MFRNSQRGPEYQNPLGQAVETAVDTFSKLPEAAVEAGKKGVDFLRKLVTGETK